MLAHNHVADADLAQLRVHIIDENFGQPDAFLRQSRLPLQPQQREGEERGDHFKSPVDMVWHTAMIPIWRPGAGHQRIIKRAHAIAFQWARGENGGQAGQYRHGASA